MLFDDVAVLNNVVLFFLWFFKAFAFSNVKCVTKNTSNANKTSSFVKILKKWWSHVNQVQSFEYLNTGKTSNSEIPEQI